MRQWLFEITSFFLPVFCPVCGFPLARHNQVMCLSCEQNLPFTRYTPLTDNPVARVFWGRVYLEAATSLLRFEKGSKYQPLLHLLKYKGRAEIGMFLGKKLGIDLADSDYAKADYIIPVPLHPSKQKTRGYNQSEIIAQGVSAITGIPVMNDLLIRSRDTISQTHKSRIERWENMKQVFCLNYTDRNFDEDTTFLLVDDVVTTGATIEACAHEIGKLSNARIYVATVACA